MRLVSDNAAADIRSHTATVDASRTARVLDAAADAVTGLLIFALDKRHH